MAIDDHGFLMGHREALAGPGHLHTPALKQGVGLIVPAVTAGGVGIEHHADPHAPLLRVKEGLLDGLALELELLDQQLGLGLIDQCNDRLGPVIGHHEKTLTGCHGGPEMTSDV